MAEQTKLVQLLRDMHYPAAWVLDYEPLKAGTIVPVVPATNIPQASRNAIRYWVNTPLLRDDPYGIGLCDGDFEEVTT
jgi:hypothetical protein